MCQSLEHFVDPIGFINSIKTFLKKDIHLYIEVPNAKWHPSNEIFHETMWTKSLLSNLSELICSGERKIWSSSKPFKDVRPIYLHLIGKINSNNVQLNHQIYKNFSSSKFSRKIFYLFSLYSKVIEKIPSYRLRRYFNPYKNKGVQNFELYTKNVNNLLKIHDLSSND